MKYSLVIFSFLFLIIFTFSSTAQETAKANKGEGVLQFLKRFNRTKSFHFDRFIEQNRDKLDKNTTVFGHSASNCDPDGVRFTKLYRYMDADFVKEHPYIHPTS